MILEDNIRTILSYIGIIHNFATLFSACIQTFGCEIQKPKLASTYPTLPTVEPTPNFTLQNPLFHSLWRSIL